MSAREGGVRSGHHYYEASGSNHGSHHYPNDRQMATRAENGNNLAMFNVRERLARRVAGLLEPGEVAAHVIRALEGPSRWLALVIGLAIGLGIMLLVQIPVLGVLAFLVFYTRLYARRVIVATDRRLVVMGGGRWTFVPSVILDSLDLETRIGPLRGLFMQIQLGERKMYVVPRTTREVAAADAELDD